MENDKFLCAFSSTTNRGTLCTITGGPASTCTDGLCDQPDQTDDKLAALGEAFDTLAQAVGSSVVRVPVSTNGSWACADGAGAPLATQVLALDERTRSLPLLYLNKINMSAAEVRRAESKLENKAAAVLAVALRLLGDRLHELQWLCVIIQCCGIAVTQYDPCAASARLSPSSTLRASQSMSSDPKWLTWTCACITFRAPRAIFTTASP